MTSICLITALPAEARPLISHFRLKALSHRHLRLYQGDFGYLLQCGVGKLNAAAATGAMLQSLPNVTAIINTGMVGCQRPLGETVIAHGIQDNASRRQWYPHLPPLRRIPNIESVQILTVDQPESLYSPDTAFDMEAAGIYSAASKLLDLAFVHSLKVVSDNAQSGIETITAQSATDSISNAIPTLEQLMQALPFDALPENNKLESTSRSLTERIHYTTTEQHALTQLLQRHLALMGTLPNNEQLRQYDTAKAVRIYLESEIDNAVVRY